MDHDEGAWSHHRHADMNVSMLIPVHGSFSLVMSVPFFFAGVHSLVISNSFRHLLSTSVLSSPSLSLSRSINLRKYWAIKTKKWIENKEVTGCMSETHTSSSTPWRRKRQGHWCSSKAPHTPAGHTPILFSFAVLLTTSWLMPTACIFSPPEGTVLVLAWLRSRYRLSSGPESSSSQRLLLRMGGSTHERQELRHGGWRLHCGWCLWVLLLEVNWTYVFLFCWSCFIFVFIFFFRKLCTDGQGPPPSPSNCSLSPQGVWRATGRKSKFGQRLSQCRCDRVRSANRQVPKVYYFYVSMYFFIAFVILSYASITLPGQQHLAWGDAVDIGHWFDTKIRCLTLWLYGINWLNKWAVTASHQNIQSALRRDFLWISHRSGI